MTTKSARRRRAAANRATQARQQTAVPCLSLVKPSTPAAPLARLSLTKRPPLPHRHPEDVHARGEQDAGRAAMTALARGIEGARVIDWQARPDGGVAEYLDDGTLLTHPGVPGAPFTAITTCVRGAAHVQLIADQRGLDAARNAADTCQTLHADMSQIVPPATIERALAGRTAAVATLQDAKGESGDG
jgi:hypothetical protein